MNVKNTNIAFMNVYTIVSMIICFVYVCAFSIYNINIFNNSIESAKDDMNIKANVETKVVPVVERTFIIKDTILSESQNSNKDIAEIPDEVVETEVTTYFDVPLSNDLQDYIFNLCEENGIDPAIVIAMIEKESSFRDYAVGDNGNSYGLMQIQPRWNKARMDALGCNDLLDPYQNVTVGIDLLSELMDKGNSIEWVLMAYNGGQTYANKKIDQGIISDYAVFVLERAKNLVNSTKM